ncbi:MAG: CPBP family intramembrane metalloprotease [Acidobacteria bacterium]|nr:CPBP family intramembrane metalloprotease [Acidobacteriota bacterium]
MSDGTPTHLTIGVRVVVFLVLSFLLQGVAYAVLQLLGPLIAAGIGIFAGGAVATVLALRIYDRGSLADIGLAGHGWAARHAATGAGLGIAAGVFVTGFPLLTGKAHFAPAPDFPFSIGALILVPVILLFAALGEELVFRGYPFQLLAGRYGTYAVLLPFSVLFAAAHGGNLNSSKLAVFNTFLWGVVLGYAVIRSGDLWLATGIHWGWNVTLPLFGVNLSGFTMGMTGYQLEWRASDLWSGGAYGPEASVLTLLVVPALFFALRRTPLRRQQLKLMPHEEEPAE